MSGVPCYIGIKFIKVYAITIWVHTNYLIQCNFKRNFFDFLRRKYLYLCRYCACYYHCKCNCNQTEYSFHVV